MIELGDGSPGAARVDGAFAVAGRPEFLGVFPALTIATAGGAPITSTETYVNATYTLIAPGFATETGPLRIRGRGNYTWGLPKKPYRLNFPADRTALGMKASQRDWALLANHDDPRKIATITGLTLGSRISGLTWTPQFRIVEVTINGDYQGLYNLTDLVRLESGRVPGEDVSGTSGDSLTGTYLLEISRRYVSEGDPGFTTSRDVMIQYDSPGVAIGDLDPEKATQAAYMRDWIQNFENVLYSSEFLNPTTGYARFVDMTSFADWYLVNEFGSNQDSYFESSCKLWKERDSLGGKLHMGPLWDMGISFGNQVNVNHAPDVWNTINATGPGATWIKRMISDPTFKTLLLQRWENMKTYIPSLLATVAEQSRRQAAAIQRDEDRWGLTHVDVEATAAYVQGWIQARAAWLDAQLPGVTGS
ncbi:CotH kinase family protein [bacterium]|nr:CotH kinase family protein [bacterium]